MSLISYSLGVAALALAVPVTVFFLEVFSAVALTRQSRARHDDGDAQKRVAVLVPAHNESTGLLPTLADIKGQISPSDRLLVVADNCSDDTGVVAAAAGAEVIDRKDPNRRGKGYALAFGIHCLSLDPPDMVIVIDADCRLAKGAIDELKAACSMSRSPAQALYLMMSPDGSINYRVAEFAWRVKNWIRPLGLANLGLPCQLMGTGMAFPWDVIRSADVATASIVEDMKLGLDLARAGMPAVFCPSACVTSTYPSSTNAIQQQRLRWEKGHVGIILTAAPPLIVAAIARANIPLLILALDVAVPPLSLLAFLVLGISAASGLIALIGISVVPILISAISLTGFLAAAFLSWWKCGREILPPGSTLMIGAYFIRKLCLYRQIFFHKTGAEWIRTDRK